MDAQWGGADPSAYHATNVAIHTVSVLLLFQLLMALGAAERRAMVGAGLFAVHPLQTQAVAWIAGRNELMLGIFALGALLTYVEYARSGRRVWLALHGVAFVLALFSKETAALLPVGIGLHALMFRTLTSRAALAIGAVESMGVAIWWVLRSQALAGSTAVNASAAEAIAQSWQPLTYFGKLLAPIRLNVMPGPDPVTMALGAIALVAAVAATRVLPARPVVFAAGWVLVFVAPSVLVPGLPAYEHRMYVPLIGAAIGIALTITPGTSTLGVATGLGLLFAVLSFLHAPVFRDATSYWQNGTLSARYAPMAHVNLGQLREQAGDLTTATEHYRRALALDPDTPKARNNLGVVLMQQQRPEEAVALFREEVRRFPQNADAWFNLGLWADMQGDTAEARRHYERALAENPAYRPAAEKLGRMP
jgi:tetratricopeptide (TPR) repeat protein